jgi:hypothetical protein
LLKDVEETPSLSDTPKTTTAFQTSAHRVSSVLTKRMLASLCYLSIVLANSTETVRVFEQYES